jgi:hypothetical protein
VTAARLLVWLVSLVVLVVPPLATGHAMAPPRPVTSVDCPDHAPPPAPCPDHGTAKHAAGDCCYAMAPMIAVLPASTGIDAEPILHRPMPLHMAGYTGCIPTKDPPPPRA